MTYNICQWKRQRRNPGWRENENAGDADCETSPKVWYFGRIKWWSANKNKMKEKERKWEKQTGWKISYQLGFGGVCYLPICRSIISEKTKYDRIKHACVCVCHTIYKGFISICIENGIAIWVIVIADRKIQMMLRTLVTFFYFWKYPPFLLTLWSFYRSCPSIQNNTIEHNFITILSNTWAKNALNLVKDEHIAQIFLIFIGAEYENIHEFTNFSWVSMFMLKVRFLYSHVGCICV